MQKLVGTRSFTLTELLVIVIIISILTGFLLAGIYKVLASADIKKVKATIEQLEVALEIYAQNWGTYPNDDGLTSGKFTGCANLIAALESYTSQAKEKGGPYVSYIATLKNIYGLLDSWGKAYRYHWNTTTYNVTAIGQRLGQPNITYNIWSCGPDGINDEMNTNPNYPEPAPPDIQRRYSDDIVNW